MPKPRLSSKRGQIYTAFLEGGVDKALVVGRALNWSESGIKSWCRKWQDETTAPKARLKEGKRGVRLSYWPEKQGFISAEGPEVSAVQFTDGTHRFIPNSQLVDL